MSEMIQGDCLSILKSNFADESIQCCVTTPPYWGLRDYGVEGQLGLEKTPEAYVAKLVEVFREVRRVLKNDGTLWLNLGDSYSGSGGWTGCTPGSSLSTSNMAGKFGNAQSVLSKVSGLKPKDLVGIPWRVAFALQADGWYLRSDIIWAKPNPMPESVTDRPTKAHEYLFLLSKSERYYYDAEAIAEPTTDPESLRGYNRSIATDSIEESGDNGYDGHRTRVGIQALKQSGKIFTTRNKRTVWTVATAPYAEAHFATFPPKLIEPCILAGCPAGGLVLDPFAGSGTTLAVAQQLGRRGVGIELNPAYLELAKERTQQNSLDLFA